MRWDADPSERDSAEVWRKGGKGEPVTSTTGIIDVDMGFIDGARQQGRQGSVTFIEEPAPEQLFCPIISADDHMLEPPTLFEGRLPSRLQDAAPSMQVQDDGARWWVIEGEAVPITILNGGCGRVMEEWGSQATEFEEFRPGIWDPVQRVHDMDMTGVWAQSCFGSVVWGFAGSRFSKMKDREVGHACLQAYNDWMFEEWYSVAPDRFIPCQLAWLCDAQHAAAEIYRNAERGVHAVSFSENPEALGFPNIYDRSWDPFFRACEETETVVNLHVGSSGQIHQPCSSSHKAVTVALFPVNGITALIDWVYSGVPIRFPALAVAMSEAGMSWVPMALERLSRAYRMAKGVGKGWPPDAPTPMELVHRNFVFTSIEDPAGFRLLDLIGEDSVMVETDYPHFDSTWPDSQKMIRGELQHLSAGVIRKVCYENAARIYHHPPPPAQMIASSEVGAQ
jgi:predicted TIM-barrel fold metal-dependent hydrolase